MGRNIKRPLKLSLADWSSSVGHFCMLVICECSFEFRLMDRDVMFAGASELFYDDGKFAWECLSGFE